MPVTLAVLETDGGGGGDDDATVFKRPEIRPRFVSLSSTCFEKNKMKLFRSS
jgi:hypothetical protein